MHTRIIMQYVGCVRRNLVLKTGVNDSCFLSPHELKTIPEGRRPNDTGSTNPPPPQGNHFQPPSNPQPHSHPRPFPPQPPTDPGRSATDFHLSVGLPWFLMTQAQERERERERMRRYQRLHRVNPAPPPQMPRFGGPPQIFIGYVGRRIGSGRPVLFVAINWSSNIKPL